MTPKQLKSRIFFKKAVSKKERAVVKRYSRRDVNIIEREEGHPNDEFESFFEFEEDLTELRSASDQFQEQEVLNDNFIVMEEETSKSEESAEFYFEESNSSNNKPIMLEELENKNSHVSCEHLTNSGNLCKNKKTDGSIYCTMHKNKLINKIKNSQNMD